MKRFRFPLRPVAMLRAHREARARETFATAVHAYVKSQENLAVMRARVAQIEAALAERRSGRFSPADEAQALAAYRRECQVEAQAEGAVEEARKQMEQRRAEFIVANQKLEVVNRLEKKARDAHQTAVNREEQAEADDFAGGRARRSSPFAA